MDNPLEQPAPDDPIARVHEFARDLAWGVALGMWEKPDFESFGQSETKDGCRYHLKMNIMKISNNSFRTNGITNYPAVIC